MHFTKEEIERARSIDLLTYLEVNEPWNLVHMSGRTYSLKEHDSLKISNGKWMWWSRGFGGTSALDFLVKVRGDPFPDAVNKILSMEGSYPPFFMPKEEPKRKLFLPARASTNEKITKYLTERGIDKDIIEELIDEGLIYESWPYHSCIFIGLDREGIPRYASYRAIDGGRKLGDLTGSDKRYSFKINRADSTLHVFESVIDFLSYATKRKLKGESWDSSSLLSLGGIYTGRRIPASLEECLDVNPNIIQVVLHLDNDEPGREATRSIMEALKDKYEVKDEPPVYGKDMNDELMYLRRSDINAEIK